MSATRGNRGFTLLELLVAITITLALAGLLLSVTTGTLNIWRRVQGNFSNATQAKLALDLLERDFQSALRRSDSGRGLMLDLRDNPSQLTNHGWAPIPTSPGRGKPTGSLSLVQPLPSAVTPLADGIVFARFGFGGSWLRFLTVNTMGQPVAVSYQIVRRPTIGLPVTESAVSHYLFYRTEVTATETLTAGYDFGVPAYASQSPTPSSAATASTITNPVLGDMLADNVVDFGVWLYSRTSSGGLVQLFPENATDIQHIALGNGSQVGNRYPDVADVMIRILTEEGASLLENMEAGRGRSSSATDSEWWELVEKHSQVFVRRIEIKGGTL